MDTQERKIIDDLFDKLSVAERQTNPPEPMAQAHICSRVEQQPSAPYLMAQTIVAQEHALGAAQTRIAELEDNLARRPAGGGFLAGLFGGGGANQPESARAAQAQIAPAAMQGAAQPAMGNSSHFGRGMPPAQAGRGGGFLAGAAQTAMGVAGGVLIGGMLGSAFGGMGGGGDKAAAAPPPAAEPEQVASNDSADAGGGDDFGGDFGGGES